MINKNIYTINYINNLFTDTKTQDFLKNTKKYQKIWKCWNKYKNKEGSLYLLKRLKTIVEDYKNKKIDIDNVVNELKEITKDFCKYCSKYSFKINLEEMWRYMFIGPFYDYIQNFNLNIFKTKNINYLFDESKEKKHNNSKEKNNIKDNIGKNKTALNSRQKKQLINRNKNFKTFNKSINYNKNKEFPQYYQKIKDIKSLKM